MNLDYDFISLKDAFAFVERSIRIKGYASLLIRNALEAGEIKATAQSILTEYAFGSIKPLADRREALHIDLQVSDNATMLINQNRLVRAPRGARLIYTWKQNRIVWIAPPSKKMFIRSKTKKPSVELQTRIVMYDVQVERQSLERILRAYLGNSKRSETLKAKTQRGYETKPETERKLILFYDLAKSGELEAQYGPFSEYRKKADLKKKLAVFGDYNRTKLQDIVKELVELDQVARRLKGDQHTT